MKNAIIGLVLIILTGCTTTLPGGVQVKESQFDGILYVYVDPGWVYKGGDIFDRTHLQMGLYWSQAHPDEYMITPVVRSTYAQIPNKDSLQFNLNGELLSLSSFDETTYSNSGYCETYDCGRRSSKSYLVSRHVLDRIIAAESAKVRVRTESGTVEADFALNRSLSAKRAFIEALAEIDSIKAKSIQSGSK